jgi:hypothetical protein
MEDIPLDLGFDPGVFEGPDTLAGVEAILGSINFNNASV